MFSLLQVGKRVKRGGAFLLRKTSKVSRSLSFFKKGITTLTNERLFAPQPIERLSVVEDIVEQARGLVSDLDKTAVFAIQHKRRATIPLVNAVLQLGVKRENFWLGGKVYSSSPPAVRTFQEMGVQVVPDAIPNAPGEFEYAFRKGMREMWADFCEDIAKKDIKRVILLCDAKEAFEEMPKSLPFKYPIAGLEQTRGSLYSKKLNKLLMPIVFVALSYAKRKLESPLIADSIINRVKELLPQTHPKSEITCGIIGNGSMGTMIVDTLLKAGYRVLVFDPDLSSFKDVSSHQHFYRVEDAATVVLHSSFIFGCTGNSKMIEGINILDFVDSDKTFVPCSTGDYEFRPLLREIAKRKPHLSGYKYDPLADVEYTTENGHKVTVLTGGFPVNLVTFAEKIQEDSTPARYIAPGCMPISNIEITQGLLIGGFVQAALMARTPVKDSFTINSANHLTLDPFIQSFAIRRWLEKRPGASQMTIEKHCDIREILKGSGGNYYEIPQLEACFSKTSKLTGKPSPS